MNEAKWYLRTPDETFGPETRETLITWAQLGRVQPGQEVSDDNLFWQKVEDVPFLDMRFSIDIGDGNPRGPFNRVAVEALLASGRLPSASKVVEVRPPFTEPAPEPTPTPSPTPTPTPSPTPSPTPTPTPAPTPTPSPTPTPTPTPTPVEDFTAVREREEALAEAARAQAALAEAVRAREVAIAEAASAKTALAEAVCAKDEEISAARQATEALRTENVRLSQAVDAGKARERALQEKLEAVMKDAVDREFKLKEQVAALEDELRRLPQAASEVADIQAAIYSIMTKESDELQKMMDLERREAEDFMQRHKERTDRLTERRHELIRRAGVNIEDMTRKALYERPEDPRTAQLRREVEELRRQDEKKTQDYGLKVRDLEERLTESQAVARRAEARLGDVTQLRNENEELRALLQRREQELLAEREQSEALRQSQAVSQQTLLARLEKLESPTITAAGERMTNQSREAHMVHLPGWMRLGK